MLSALRGAGIAATEVRLDKADVHAFAEARGYSEEQMILRWGHGDLSVQGVKVQPCGLRRSHVAVDGAGEAAPLRLKAFARWLTKQTAGAPDPAFAPAVGKRPPRRRAVA